MPDTIVLLRDRLVGLLDERGAKAELCRKTGIARSVLERWLSGDGAPSLESIDLIANHFGMSAWELLKPEGAVERKSPTVEEQAKIIVAQEKRIHELESKYLLDPLYEEIAKAKLDKEESQSLSHSLRNILKSRPFFAKIKRRYEPTQD